MVGLVPIGVRLAVRLEEKALPLPSWVGVGGVGAVGGCPRRPRFHWQSPPLTRSHEGRGKDLAMAAIIRMPMGISPLRVGVGAATAI